MSIFHRHPLNKHLIKVYKKPFQMSKNNYSESVVFRNKFPDNIDKLQPYEMCRYFAYYKQPLARYTYIIYKEEKINWITSYKQDNDNEPTQAEKDNHVRRLTVDDYNEYVKKANEYLMNDMQTLPNASIAADIEAQVLKENVIQKIGKDLENINKKSYDLIDNLLINILGGTLVAIVIEFISSLRDNATKDIASTLTAIFVIWVIISSIVYFLRIRKYKNAQKED